MTLDELRTSQPYLGFALYAYTPGSNVTLEVHSGTDVFTFVAATEAEVIAKAFPALVSGVPSVACPTGVVAAEPETATTDTRVGLTDGTPETSVFD